MHDQRVTVRQSGQEIFAAASDGSYRLSPQPPCEALWKRLTQIRTIEANTRKTRAAHGGIERSPNAFDFWKFRHRRQRRSACFERERERTMFLRPTSVGIVQTLKQTLADIVALADIQPSA
jgi:hypothetical protein